LGFRTHGCRGVIVSLYCGHDSPDQAGTTGSLPCAGTVADGLGREDVSDRASARDGKPDGDSLTCKKLILMKKWR
jgi:hypothetical protein